MDVKSFFFSLISIWEFCFAFQTIICRSSLSNIIPNYVHREIDQDFISIFTNAFKTESQSQR